MSANRGPGRQRARRMHTWLLALGIAALMTGLSSALDPTKVQLDTYELCVGNTGEVGAIHYDIKRSRIWYSYPPAASYIGYVDEKTCTKLTSGIGTYFSNTVGWNEITAIETLPDGSVLVGTSGVNNYDAKCTISLVSPDGSAMSSFYGWGGSCLDLRMNSPANQVGYPPQNVWYMGNVRGIAYSVFKKTTYVFHEMFWAYAEIWATDGVTSTVIAKYDSVADMATSVQAGWSGMAMDPHEDYLYTVTFVAGRVYKILTRPPYTVTLIFSAPGYTPTIGGYSTLISDPSRTGVSYAPRGSRIGTVSNIDGQFAIVFPVGGYTVYGPLLLLDRDGAVIAEYDAPPLGCPVSGGTINWAQCWAPANVMHRSENGVIYVTYVNLGAGTTSLHAIRVFAVPASVEVSGGATIEITGGSIEVRGEL